MADIILPGCILTVTQDFKPGDQAPTGYLDWHEWADVQHKAGLKQVECGRCGKWKYPQQLSNRVDVFTPKNKRGEPVTIEPPVCNDCNAKAREHKP
jgi:hypothetical protein